MPRRPVTAHGPGRGRIEPNFQGQVSPYKWLSLLRPLEWKSWILVPARVAAGLPHQNFIILAKCQKSSLFWKFCQFSKILSTFFSDNPIMFGLKMIGLTRAIQICSHFIIHLIPAQTIAIFVPNYDISIK